MPFLTAIFALLIGISWQGVAQAADPKASRLYEDALVRYENRDFKGAIIQLKNAIQIDRKMLPVQLLLGRALLAEGQVIAAEAAFDEALKQGANPIEVVLPLAETMMEQGRPDVVLSDPRFAHLGLPTGVRAKALLIKAAAASDVGRTPDALRFLHEARSLNVNDAESWIAEVPIRVRAKQLPEAKTAADKAASIDPRSPKAVYQQATVAHVGGDLGNALALYTRTLALKSDHVDALVARAGLLIDLQRLKEASTDINAARTADPKDPRSAYLSALLAEREGNDAAAKRALNEVTGLLDPVPITAIRYRPQVLMLGGMSHFALGQYEKALPYLEAVVGQGANPVSKLLAQIYLRQNQADKAVSALEAYLRTRPDDNQAKKLLATSQLAMGRNARAASLLEEALAKSDDPSMRALLGLSLVGAGKFESGAAELEATLKKDPGQIQAGVSLISLYIASNQGGRAVTIAQGLVKRKPNHAGLRSLLGSALAANGDAKGARAAFVQALDLDPSYVEPMLNLARLDIDERALESALARLNTLLTKDDKNIDAMVEVARMHSAAGRADEALRWLQKAADNSGPRLQPGLQLIEFHLARSRPDLAAEALKSLQGKAPESLVVLLAQARVQLATGELSSARTTLTRAATLAAYDPAALARIGELQLAAGNLPGAAHALDKALAAKPNHLRARALRSRVHLLQGEPTKAEELARSVMASDPKMGMGHSLMGDLALSRNQPAIAASAYRRAHEIDQTSDSLVRLFGVLELSQRPAAYALAETWLRSRPSDTTVWRTLADARARAGNLPAARTAYESLVKLNPLDAEALNNLAIILVSMKDAAAVTVAERALALKPQTPHIIGTAGWAAFHAGQPDRAVQLLRDARLRDPNNAGTRYFLGVVLAQQGRTVEARAELEAARKSGSGFPHAKEVDALLHTLK